MNNEIREKGELVEVAELTRENIRALSEETGRDEEELWNAFYQAKARGTKAVLLLKPTVQEIFRGNA